VKVRARPQQRRACGGENCAEYMATAEEGAETPHLHAAHVLSAGAAAPLPPPPHPLQQLSLIFRAGVAAPHAAIPASSLGPMDEGRLQKSRVIWPAGCGGNTPLEFKVKSHFILFGPDARFDAGETRCAGS
jgi:hypothetical protein